MRNLAAIAVTGSILLASSPAIAADPQAMRTAQVQPIAHIVQPLAPEGAFLSLALPGAGQFYQGDPLRGGAYLGASLGLAGGLAAIQFPLFGMFPSGEQIAFATVQGLVISWLVVGGISAYDAYHSILAKQPATPVSASTARADDPIAPSPAPTASPVVLSAPPSAPPSPPVSQAPAAPDAEAIVLESYRLADGGDHWQAVTLLLSISDPAWLPKARTLLSAWGDAAGAQGLVISREKLARGDRAAARAALDRLEKLPLKPSLRQQALALRRELGDRP